MLNKIEKILLGSVVLMNCAYAADTDIKAATQSLFSTHQTQEEQNNSAVQICFKFANQLMNGYSPGGNTQDLLYAKEYYEGAIRENYKAEEARKKIEMIDEILNLNIRSSVPACFRAANLLMREYVPGGDTQGLLYAKEYYEGAIRENYKTEEARKKINSIDTYLCLHEMSKNFAASSASREINLEEIPANYTIHPSESESFLRAIAAYSAPAAVTPAVAPPEPIARTVSPSSSSGRTSPTADNMLNLKASGAAERESRALAEQRHEREVALERARQEALETAEAYKAQRQKFNIAALLTEGQNCLKKIETIAVDPQVELQEKVAPLKKEKADIEEVLGALSKDIAISEAKIKTAYDYRNGVVEQLQAQYQVNVTAIEGIYDRKNPHEQRARLEALSELEAGLKRDITDANEVRNATIQKINQLISPLKSQQRTLLDRVKEIKDEILKIEHPAPKDTNEILAYMKNLIEQRDGNDSLNSIIISGDWS